MQEGNELLKQNKPKLMFEGLKQTYDEVARHPSIQYLRDKKKYEKGRKKSVFEKQM